MANTFQKNLSSPQAPGARVEAVPHSGVKRSIIGDLSSVLGVIGKGMQVQDRQAAQTKQEADTVAKGQALGDAQIGVLDIENRTLEQSQERSALIQETTNIHSDGVVTPEEQLRLDAIEKQKKKFDLLDPTTRQLRLNALHKETLNATANLAIQPQINSIFSQGRSQISVPRSTQEEQLNATMDSLHGVGNWSPSQAGQYAGNQMYLANVQQQGAINFAATTDESYKASLIMGGDIFQQLQTKLATQGALHPDDINIFTNSILSAKQSARLHIQQLKINNRKNGVDISAQAKVMMEEMDSVFDGYLNLVKSEEAFGSGVMFKTIMANTASLQRSITQVNNPALAAAGAGVMGSGSGGGITQLAQMLNMPDNYFASVQSSLPPELRTSVPEMKAQIAKSIQLAITGTSLKALAEMGAVNKNVALTVASIGIPNQEKDVTENYLNTLNLAEHPDISSIMEVLEQPKTVAALNNHKIAPTALARHLLEIIISKVPDGQRKYMTQDEDGRIQITLPTKGRTGLGSADYTNTLLDQYNTFLSTYSGSLGDKKQFTDVLMETEANDTGAPPLTGRANKDTRPVFVDDQGIRAHKNADGSFEEITDDAL